VLIGLRRRANERLEMARRSKSSTLHHRRSDPRDLDRIAGAILLSSSHIVGLKVERT
jgi:hypothetical protein